MKYIRSNFKEYKISAEEVRKIKYNLDLYDMYIEYTKECDKILVKIKDLNSKLDKNENEVMEYVDHKNKLISENEFSKLSLDLQKNLMDREIILITEGNMNEYVSFPNFILEVFEELSLSLKFFEYSETEFLFELSSS